MSDWINEKDSIPGTMEKVLMMVADKNEKFNIFIGFIDEEDNLNVCNTHNGLVDLYISAEKLSDDKKLICWMPLPEEPVRKYSYRFQRKNTRYELIAELPYDLSCGKCPIASHTHNVCKLNYSSLSEDGFYGMGRPDCCELKPVDRDIEW